jgi:hypothetical protein
MAFFGLTTLGSQSPFELAKETPLYVFEPSDWQDAFLQTFQPGFSLYSESDEEVASARRTLATATLTLDDLPSLLRHLYKCPKGIDNVPELAKQQMIDGFTGFQGRPISLSECLEVADRVRHRAELDERKQQQYAYLKDGPRSREFVSGLELRGTLVKHSRMDRNPTDKALAPLTDTQTLGWLKPTSTAKRHPTKSCEETKYASAMVKAGVYYY